MSQHPAFSVLIEVSHHYQQSNLAKGEQAKPGEVEVNLSSGPAVRKLVEHHDPYQIDFGAGAIDAILADRAAVKAMEAEHAKNGVAFSPIQNRSFNQIVAKHIEDAAMAHASPVDCWCAIWVRAPASVAGAANLEAFLQTDFDLPGECHGEEETPAGDTP